MIFCNKEISFIKNFLGFLGLTQSIVIFLKLRCTFFIAGTCRKTHLLKSQTGTVKGCGIRRLNDLTRWLAGWICGKTVAQATQTTLHAATAPLPLDHLTGKFLSDCRVTSVWANSQLEDAKMCAELWKETSYLLRLENNL